MVLCRMHANDLTTTDDVTVGDDLIVTGLCTIGETLAVTGAVTAASLELGGSGAVPTEFSTDGTLGGNSDTAIPTEKAVKTYVATVLGGVDYALMKGFIERPMFEYSSTTALTLTSGRVHIRGDAQGAGIHWWDSTLTFTAESGGSNADSDDFGTSEWHYLYIDDSSLSDNGATELTAANFRNDTTAPTWDADELGWYDANGDRCIGGFYVDSNGDLEEFWHDGGTQISYTTDYDIYSIAYPGTNYATTVTLHAPSFCRSGEVTFESYPNSDCSWSHGWYRPTGSSGSGHRVSFQEYSTGDNRQTMTTNTLKTFCDASQSIDIKVDVADGNNRLRLWSSGYYLPRGM